MSTLNLDGVESIKGRKVKLLYIDKSVSIDTVLLGRFDDIWVSVPSISDLSYRWELLQGVIYVDRISSVIQSEITTSNRLDKFTLEFTLEDLEYQEDYLGEMTQYEPMRLAVGNCLAFAKAFTCYKPTDKIIMVTHWDRIAESICALDGIKRANV
jgi:hypothetical protein